MGMSSRPMKLAPGEGDATNGTGGGGNIASDGIGPTTLAPGSTSISLIVASRARGQGTAGPLGARPSASSRARSAKFTTAAPASPAVAPGTTPGTGAPGGADAAIEPAGHSMQTAARRNALHSNRAHVREVMATSGGR